MTDLTFSVGVVGLGAIGGRIAKRLVDAGTEVFVFDTRAEATADAAAYGAIAAPSAKGVADRASVVLASLPDPNAVRRAALGDDGVVAGSSVATYIELSTVGPRCVQEVASDLANHGISLLDAPISGGTEGAATGSLSLMAAGPTDVFERCRTVLDLLGSHLFFIGERAGQGQAMKLVNNLLTAGALALTSEAITLGSHQGLDLETMLNVLNASSGHNTATRDKFPRAVLPRSYDYGFSMRLMCKDLALCMENALQFNSPMVVGQSVAQIWNLVLAAQEDPDADFTLIARQIAAWAGTGSWR